MILQAIKTKLLAVGLLTTSIAGTFAIFGVVPMMAKLFSPNPSPAPNPFHAFPEHRDSSLSKRTSETTIRYARSPYFRGIPSSYSPRLRSSL